MQDEVNQEEEVESEYANASAGQFVSMHSLFLIKVLQKRS